MPETMRAMVFSGPGKNLELHELPIPQPSPDEVLIRISACGVCRTDLHIVDGELLPPTLPLIPGHEIVGCIAAKGTAVKSLHIGDRVGVPWLAKSCGSCDSCLHNQENLCQNAQFTGFHRPGGYAEYTVANHQFCFPIPERYPDTHAAPLLCAGLIGYRAFTMCRRKQQIGIYGFGAAGHILTQLAAAQGYSIYAFTRPGNIAGQNFARSLGAVWAGDSDRHPPEKLDAAILFAPAGHLVPQALSCLKPGGIVVCAGIYMSDIPTMPYALLWQERSIQSVANLTRRDGHEFFELIKRYPVTTTIDCYPLEQANSALANLRTGKLQGAAAVLTMQR